MSTTSPAAEVDEASLESRVWPTWQSPGIFQLSRWVGGPFGQHGTVGRQRFFTPTRALFVLALIGLVLGLGSKAPCVEQHQESSGRLNVLWSGHLEYATACYLDIVPLYFSEGFDKGRVPYRDPRPDDSSHEQHWMEYPVLTGYFQYASAVAARSWASLARVGVVPPLAEPLVFFLIAAVAIVFAWLTTIWLTARLAGDRVWDVWLVALSPVVFVQVFTNYDGLGILFLIAGLYAWQRGSPLATGLLVGVGAAIKLFPVLLFLPLLLWAVRHHRVRDWLKALSAALAVLVVVNLPVYLAYPRGWSEFFRYNRDRPPQEGSLLYVFDYLRNQSGLGPNTQMSADTANIISLICFTGACALIVLVYLKAPTEPSIAQLTFLTMAAFLLSNKVWSSQYSLWLVPLAVLALPSPGGTSREDNSRNSSWGRLLLSWMFLELLNWLFRSWWFYTGFAQNPDPTIQRVYMFLLLLRDGVLVAMMALVVLSLYRQRPAQTEPARAPELARAAVLG